ncbi:MAG: hypothetical protein ABIP38_11665, partial [Steroidobacteraceae bacterium]
MTAAGPIGSSPPGATPQTAADCAAPDDQSGADFTAALAEAVAPAATTAADAPAQIVAEDPQAAVPDGTQSDAALAWMAGMLNEIRLPELPEPVACVNVEEGAAAAVQGAQFAPGIPLALTKSAGANAGTAAK